MNEFQQPAYGPPYPPQPPAPDPVKLQNQLRRREYNTLGYALFSQLGLSVGITFAVAFGAIFVSVFSSIQRTGVMPDLTDPYALIPVWLLPLATLLAMTTANLIPSIAFSNRLRLDIGDMFKPKATTVWVILGGAAVCLAVNYAAGFFMQLLNGLLSGVHVELTTPDIDLSYDTFGNIAMLIYTVLIAPITEELLCRGLLLRTLQRTGRTFAIVASSLLFAMLHGNFIQSIPTFLIGLVLGYIAIRCGSILPTILIHIINNGYVMLLQSLNEAFDWVVFLEYGFLGVCVVAAAIVLWRERGRFRLLNERRAPKGSYGLLFTSWAILVNLVFYLGLSFLFIRIF